jgi:hypothetical protein
MACPEIAIKIGIEILLDAEDSELNLVCRSVSCIVLVEHRSNFPGRRPVDATGVIPEGDEDEDVIAATIDGPRREEGDDIVTRKCLKRSSRRIIGVRRAEGGGIRG